MFEKGQSVGVAVSGGADSVCLLHVLLELAPRWDLQLSVVHLDHQLRGEESRQDALFVEALARDLGLRAHMQATDVGRRAAGDNLEQAARNARREFFLHLLGTRAVDRIALGHTRSDQAETVLFRFLRGAGTAGLAGIRPVTVEGLIRPLLGIERAEAHAFLKDRGIEWRDDSTNSSLDFARNRIRQELLPQLTREWNPGLVETLTNTADWALEEDLYWEAELDRLAATHLRLRPPAVFLRADQLTDLPSAVARRLVRRAIQLVKGDLRGIDFAHVQEILALARAEEGHGRLQAPGTDVYRSFEWLRFAPPRMDTMENRNFQFPLPVPGRVNLPYQSSAIALDLAPGTTCIESCHPGYNESISSLDWGRVSGFLVLRNWRPGDQYRPVGHAVAEKIKLLFQRARIPLWERRSWPVITRGEEIIWARRFGPASTYAATVDSQEILHVREISADSWNQ